MTTLRKRERASNFDKTEIRLLTELVTKYRSVVENKKTDAVTNKEKDAAWSTIASTFNAATSGPTERTPKTLKLKYEGLKKSTKKKMTLHRHELYRTGGGPSAAPAFDDVEEKVLAMCSNISGLEARNDSDNFVGILLDTYVLLCNSMVYKLKHFRFSIDNINNTIMPIVSAIPRSEEEIPKISNNWTGGITLDTAGNYS